MFLYKANTCKWQTLPVHTVHLLHKLAESHIMLETNCQIAGSTSRKHKGISIFRSPKVKSGISKHKSGENNILT